MANIIEIKSEPPKRFKEGSEGPERFTLKEGFVPAKQEVRSSKPFSVQVNPVRFAKVVGTGLRYDVVQEGDQFYVVKKGTMEPVTKPVGGAFIAFGQLKDLEGGRPATPLGGVETKPNKMAEVTGQGLVCECPRCGYRKEVDEGHCKDVVCPQCGVALRRIDRPGPGQISQLTEKGESAKKTEEEKEREAEERLEDLTKE